jgi:hypothetical protein
MAGMAGIEDEIKVKGGRGLLQPGSAASLQSLFTSLAKLDLAAPFGFENL